MNPQNKEQTLTEVMVEEVSTTKSVRQKTSYGAARFLREVRGRSTAQWKLVCPAHRRVDPLTSELPLNKKVLRCTVMCSQIKSWGMAVSLNSDLNGPTAWILYNAAS